jgi:chromosome partitioning protein
MPIIVAANPKGGSGKSTTCIVLGTTLASQGASVRIIDADPQRTLARWSEGNSVYREIVVTPSATEDLTDLIDRLQAEYQFVLIDVQGTANQEMVAAMSRADLVLIPMQAKTADADVATRAIKLLRTQESLFKRSIPHAIVFIRTSPIIITREEKEIRNNIEAAGIPRFTASLNERTAFSHMFAYKNALVELNSKETNGLEAAQINAVELTAEMVQLLRKQMVAMA